MVKRTEGLSGSVVGGVGIGVSDGLDSSLVRERMDCLVEAVAGQGGSQQQYYL